MGAPVFSWPTAEGLAAPVSALVNVTLVHVRIINYQAVVVVEQRWPSRVVG